MAEGLGLPFSSTVSLLVLLFNSSEGNSGFHRRIWRPMMTSSGLVMENSAPGQRDAVPGHISSCVIEWNTEQGSPKSWKAPCIYAGEAKAAGEGDRAGKQGDKGIDTDLTACTTQYHKSFLTNTFKATPVPKEKTKSMLL